MAKRTQEEFSDTDTMTDAMAFMATGMLGPVETMQVCARGVSSDASLGGEYAFAPVPSGSCQISAL